MQLFLERLIYFWAAITAIGLLLVILAWAISSVIYVAFVSLLLAIVFATFYHFYWAKRTN